MIIRGAEITGPVRESADVCIIGSGCGGGRARRYSLRPEKRSFSLKRGVITRRPISTVPNRRRTRTCTRDARAGDGGPFRHSPAGEVRRGEHDGQLDDIAPHSGVHA